MILSRDHVRAAYERALALQEPFSCCQEDGREAAVLAAAQALGVAPELVREALEEQAA